MWIRNYTIWGKQCQEPDAEVFPYRWSRVKATQENLESLQRVAAAMNEADGVGYHAWVVGS